MADLTNTAVLPVGQTVSKYHEVTPDPEVLKQFAHVVTVKPSSGVVLVHDKAGRVIARYFDVEFAQEEFEAAGLEFGKFDKASNSWAGGLHALTVLKKEQADGLARKRILARPDRRLRSERRKERADAAAPSPRPSPPMGARENSSRGSTTATAGTVQA